MVSTFATTCTHTFQISWDGPRGSDFLSTVTILINYSKVFFFAVYKYAGKEDQLVSVIEIRKENWR